MDLKCGAVEKLRQGGGTARFTQTCAGEEQKMCLSRAGFDTSTTVPKPPVLDVASVKCDQKKQKTRKRETVPCRRTSTDPQAGLGAPFPGSGRAELPLPSVRSATSPPLFSSLNASVPSKNTSLDTHKPTIAFPEPTEMYTFLPKPCFFFLCGQLLWGGSLVLPVSYLPFMRRGEDDR